MTRLIVLPEARDDLADAQDWYERQRRGHGKRFLDHVSECFESIRRSPGIHQRLDGTNVHVNLVRDFPYIVLYRVEPRRAVNFAVMHTSRDADTWRSRLDEP